MKHDENCPYIDMLNAQEMIITTLASDLEWIEKNFAEYKSAGLMAYNEWKKEVISHPNLKDYLLRVECERALGRQLVRMYTRGGGE
jgi:hypothetical protein